MIFSSTLIGSDRAVPPSFPIITSLPKRTRSGLLVFQIRIPKSKSFTCLLENRPPLLLSGTPFPFEGVTIFVRHFSSVGISIHLKFAEISLYLFYPLNSSAWL